MAAYGDRGRASVPIEGAPMRPDVESELAAAARRVAAEKMQRPIMNTHRVLYDAYAGPGVSAVDVGRPAGPEGHYESRNYSMPARSDDGLRQKLMKFFGSR